TYTILSGAQPGMTLDPNTGAFQWTPGELQDGTYPVTFAVSDNGAPARFDTQTVTLTVSEVNAAPALADPGDPTVAAGTAVAFALSATDPDVVAGSPNRLSFRIASGALSGMSLDPDTGAFHWVPDALQAGVHPVTFEVTDDGNPARSDVQAVLIT